MQGKIIKGISGFYYIHVAGSGIYECKAKGVFRNQNIKPLVVDNVEIAVLDEEHKKGNIEKVLPRENELIRPAVANIDLALIIFAAAKPQPNFNLLDRFLVMMEYQNVPVAICFNKTDLVTEEELHAFADIYAACGYRTLYVRLNEKQKKEGMETLQAVWKKVNPNEYFTYIDVYEVFMQRNHRTTDMANLLLMYSIISILLTCFGLFGMALYATKQRTKEIGIRKVNGASTRSIMLLLIRQFVKWIAVAFVIATPLAWVLLNRWLESFANRISISPLYFLMGGGIVLAITLLTVGWHSYRAASSNPVKSLKSE